MSLQWMVRWWAGYNKGMKTPAPLPACAVGLLAFILTCQTANAADRVQFNRDIRPILSDKCFFCHGPDAKKREADLRLDVREDAIKSDAFEPGKPDDAEILRRVLSQDPDERMPPPASKLEPLTEREVQLLRQWIAEGAEYQAHWSFIPLEPAAASGSNPIDQYVQARLEKRGLAPQPSADRATLIRRLSFDLTGLPPSPQDVQQFTSDPSPKAYEELVDRLLASPRYGERMAVDWLDTARYADSYGFQVDREREMWPYRDWVVRAFNSNMPYDQFITWQVAGDLLPNATDDQILATAFNRLHQQESEGGSVEEEYRVEYVCDRVQTFATAFLGLTFECARCHDHKYDPVTQRDYYGLFAMFQNIDEAGLYSYFTQSPPTPTLWLADSNAKSRLQLLTDNLQHVEDKSRDLRVRLREKFKDWRQSQASLAEKISRRNSPSLFKLPAWLASVLTIATATSLLTRSMLPSQPNSTARIDLWLDESVRPSNSRATIQWIFPWVTLPDTNRSACHSG